jgi:hypothetical protein
MMVDGRTFLLHTGSLANNLAFRVSLTNISWLLMLSILTEPN